MSAETGLPPHAFEAVKSYLADIRKYKEMRSDVPNPNPSTTSDALGGSKDSPVLPLAQNASSNAAGAQLHSVAKPPSTARWNNSGAPNPWSLPPIRQPPPPVPIQAMPVGLDARTSMWHSMQMAVAASRYGGPPGFFPQTTFMLNPAASLPPQPEVETELDPMRKFLDISAPIRQCSSRDAVTLMNVFYLTMNSFTGSDLETVTEQMLDRFQQNNPTFRYSQEMVDVGDHSVRVWTLNFAGTLFKGIGSTTRDALTEAMCLLVEEIEKFPELALMGGVNRRSPQPAVSHDHSTLPVDPAEVNAHHATDDARALSRKRLTAYAETAVKHRQESRFSSFPPRQPSVEVDEARDLKRSSPEGLPQTTSAELLSKVREIFTNPSSSDPSVRKPKTKDEIMSELKKIMARPSKSVSPENIDIQREIPVVSLDDEAPAAQQRRELLELSERILKKSEEYAGYSRTETGRTSGGARDKSRSHSVERRESRTKYERRSSVSRERRKEMDRHRKTRSRSNSKRPRSKAKRRSRSRHRKRESRSRSPKNRRTGSRHRSQRSAATADRSQRKSRSRSRHEAATPPPAVKRSSKPRFDVVDISSDESEFDLGLTPGATSALQRARDIRKRITIKLGANSTQPSRLDDEKAAAATAETWRELASRKLESLSPKHEILSDEYDPTRPLSPEYQRDDLTSIHLSPLRRLERAGRDRAPVDTDITVSVDKSSDSRVIHLDGRSSREDDSRAPYEGDTKTEPWSFYNAPAQTPLVTQILRPTFDPVPLLSVEFQQAARYAAFGVAPLPYAQDVKPGRSREDPSHPTPVWPENRRGDFYNAFADADPSPPKRKSVFERLGSRQTDADHPEPWTESPEPDHAPRRSALDRLGAMGQEPILAKSPSTDNDNSRQDSWYIAGRRSGSDEDAGVTKLQALFRKQIRAPVSNTDYDEVVRQVNNFHEAYGPDFELQNMHDVRTKERISSIQIDNVTFEGRGRQRPEAIFRAAEQFLKMS